MRLNRGAAAREIVRLVLVRRPVILSAGWPVGPLIGCVGLLVAVKGCCGGAVMTVARR
jgi:hypothetical protein